MVRENSLGLVLNLTDCI
jgi:GTPase KRas